MNPARLPHNQNEKRPINGPRPAPLRVSKDSHAIQKTSNSRPHLPCPAVDARVEQRRHPVIIYAHSPKVIHAKPCEFMALVQKLTGLSPTGKEIEETKNQSQMNTKQAMDDPQKCPQTDMPLFTPNSANFFFSPPSLYKCADTISLSPILRNSASPSVLQVKKELPQY
ncbi:hypothetical protein NMG60_11018949 [Bertholletia excelsa]